MKMYCWENDIFWLRSFSYNYDNKYFTRLYFNEILCFIANMYNDRDNVECSLNLGYDSVQN